MSPSPESSRNDLTANIRLIALGVLVISAFLLGLGLYWLSDLLEPLFIAFFAFFLLRPAAEFLSEKRVPTWSSYAAVVFVFGAIFFGIGLIFVDGAAKLRHDVEVYATSISDWYQNPEEDGWFRGSWLERGINDFAREQGWVDASGRVDWSGNLQKQLVGPMVRASTAVFGGLGDVLGTLLIVLFYLIFIILESVRFPERVKRAFPRRSDRVLEIGRSIGNGIRDYVQIKTLISLGTAGISAIALWLFDVENWALWSTLIFFFNFIPYIGSIIASILPTLQAFFPIVETTAEGEVAQIATIDISTGIFIAVILAGNQILWGNFLEPKLAGNRLDISPVALLIVVAFWGWMWGIVGMVLSVPLAVALKIILRTFSPTKPLAVLMSGR